MEFRKVGLKNKKPIDLSNFVNEWFNSNIRDEKYDLAVRKTSNSLTFSLERLKEIRTAKINIDECSISLLNHKVTSCYFKNYNYINLVGVNCMEKFPEIKSITEKLPTMEIVEMDKNKIVLKEMVDPSTLNIKTILLDMVQNEKVLFDELTKDDNHKKHLLAQSLDNNINRLTYLGYKALNFNLETIRYEHDLRRTILYWRVIAALENIGDILKRVARYLRSGEPHNPLVGTIISDVREYFSLICSHLFGKKSKFEEKFNEYLDRKQSLLRSFEEFTMTLHEEVNLAVLLTQLFKDILGEINTLVFVIVEYE
jgi:hypothetical protein